jgi:hypothetical protein
MYLPVQQNEAADLLSFSWDSEDLPFENLRLYPILSNAVSGFVYPRFLVRVHVDERAQSVWRLATGWRAEGSEFESR